MKTIINIPVKATVWLPPQATLTTLPEMPLTTLGLVTLLLSISPNPNLPPSVSPKVYNLPSAKYRYKS